MDSPCPLPPPTPSENEETFMRDFSYLAKELHYGEPPPQPDFG